MSHTLILEYERLFWRLYPLPQGLTEPEEEEYATHVRRVAKLQAQDDMRLIGNAMTFEEVEQRIAQLVMDETTKRGGLRNAA